MNTPLNDGPALARAAADALRRGDARAARDLFLQAAKSGQVDVAVLLGLGFACRALQDWGGMGASADRVLALEPRNLRALLMKGDSLDRNGDTKAASAYYRAALRSAPPADKLPPDLLQELRRVQQVSEQFAKRYEDHLRSWLRERGFDESQANSRFGQSLDILVGRKRVYLQEPRYFYFPQLPQKQFYDRADFPWLDAVEAATDDIRAELQAVLQDAAAFTPYVKGDPNRPHSDQMGMTNSPAWTAFYLWQNGELNEANAARCPKTLAALAAAPLARISGRTPSVLFSQLQPGAHIPPHNGLINTRLIVHLPLLVPGKCRLRVGNEVREWQEGKAWVFDDSIDHEAWNDSDRTRVILLFDIARPELTDEENRWVSTLFEGIDAFTGQKPEWDI
jgi:aspartyl/asparaginyl beta-hydroxylase (cupin superfamily)